MKELSIMTAFHLIELLEMKVMYLFENLNLLIQHAVFICGSNKFQFRDNIYRKIVKISR